MAKKAIIVFIVSALLAPFFAFADFDNFNAPVSLPQNSFDSFRSISAKIESYIMPANWSRGEGLIPTVQKKLGESAVNLNRSIAPLNSLAKEKSQSVVSAIRRFMDWANKRFFTLMNKER